MPATSVRQPGARAKRAGHQQHRALWLQEARAAKPRRLAARQRRGCHSNGTPKRLEQRGARRQVRWQRGLREKSEEGRGFLTPAPSSFYAENDKAAAASTKQLRIGVPALALRRAGQSNARLRIGSGLRLALAHERGDQCRIDGELSSVPEGRAIAHDLDPSGVADRHINVHVSDANIARNTRSGLATDAGKGMLERQRPSRKNTRGGTGGSVVTQRVEAAAAAASAGAERQGKAQPSKQQDPELRAGDGDIVRSGQDREHTAGVWPGLGEQQGTRRGRKVSKVRLERALVAGSASHG